MKQEKNQKQEKKDSNKNIQPTNKKLSKTQDEKNNQPAEFHETPEKYPPVITAEKNKTDIS